MKSKDKRYTINQVMNEVHKAYDHFEMAAQQTLREKFGFGQQRIDRFIEGFSEVSARECERIRAEMKSQRRR